MPSRKRSQEAKRAARAAERRKQRSNRKKSKRGRKPGRTSKIAGSAGRRPDPSDVPGAEVRFVQAADADKPYRCPGCNGVIPPGMGHMVVVPPYDPDLRRHWHRGCWTNRHGRY
jgi:hypothetical protein